MIRAAGALPIPGPVSPPSSERIDGSTRRPLGDGSAAAGTLVRVKTPRSAWITYTALRLLFFAAPFALIYALGLSLQFSMMLSALIAAVLSALISVSLSVLLLSKPREAASESIYEWRNRERTADDIVEDEAIEASETAGPVSDAGTPAETETPVAETAADARAAEATGTAVADDETDAARPERA